jgi:hypothetical protein
MSPKSRGRPKGRGRPKKPNRSGPVRQIYPADRAISEARQLVEEESRLVAESMASGWLGEVWLASGVADRDEESTLILGVVGRAHNKPTPHGYAAVRALRLVSPAADVKVLDESIAMLGEDFADPSWVATEAPRPIAAYVAADPWGSTEILLVEYAGDDPHGLLAHVVHPGGTAILRLGILDPGSAQRWDEITRDAPIPMPLVERPIDEVLTKLAAALRRTMMTWPKNDDPDYVELQALAAARVAEVTVDSADWEPISDAERASLIDDFFGRGGLPDDDANRIVADCCVDYGDGYIDGDVLAWSPEYVELFLLDWLPRKVLLSPEDRAAVPAVTRAWVQFALDRTGVDQQWIDPVVEVVDELAEDFAAAYDDDSAWGPAKAIVGDLVARGVDVADKDQMELAIREYNAEQLANRLLEE